LGWNSFKFPNEQAQEMKTLVDEEKEAEYFAVRCYCRDDTGREVVIEAVRLFEKGMQFYVEKRYAQAVEKLPLAAEKEPDTLSFQFYLGLSYLLAEKTDEAIDHFEMTIELGGNFLLEKAHWYLGNAYLLKENGERVLKEFREVVEMEGDYEWEAREVIAGIEKMKRNTKN
jgi:tetratricopeptide (TPR) repeat protein